MALYKESDNSDDPALRKQVDASGDKLKAAITPFVENGKAVASSPSDQGLITAWRMSANKLLEIVGEVTRLFAELNMYGYDSLARAAAGAAGNGNGGQAQQPRHVPIELPPPIPPPPSQVSRLIHMKVQQNHLGQLGYLCPNYFLATLVLYCFILGIYSNQMAIRENFSYSFRCPFSTNNYEQLRTIS